MLARTGTKLAPQEPEEEWDIVATKEIQLRQEWP